MTANEVGFVDNIMNIDKYVNQIQEDVKNIYNVDTKYDSESNTILLNESDTLKISSAKQYILSKIDENLITIEY